MTMFSENVLNVTQETPPVINPSKERNLLTYSKPHLQKIKRLLDSNEEINIRMAFQIVKGIGIIPELFPYLTDSFLKIMVCLEEEMLAPLENLRKLELFALEQLNTLPESIGKLSQLKMINLCANALRSIPESLGKLRRLQYLNLDSNHLTALPESIGQLQQLEWLELGQNKLEVLPQSIGYLANLRYLNLNQNQLTQLPTTLIKLKNLTELYLEGNQFTTSQIKQLKRNMPTTRVIF